MIKTQGTRFQISKLNSTTIKNTRVKTLAHKIKLYKTKITNTLAHKTKLKLLKAKEEHKLQTTKLNSTMVKNKNKDFSSQN